MSLIDLVSLHLAMAALIEAWTDGKLFYDMRFFLEERPHTFKGLISGLLRETVKVLTPTADKLAELLSCSFCLSYHIPWVLLVLLKGCGVYTDPRIYFPIHSLAMTFVINRLMNITKILREAGAYVSARNFNNK